MRCFRLILLLSGTALAGGLPGAQSAGTRLFNTDPAPVIRAWGTAAGLPQNTVHTIIQSHDGYLWLGTSDGLVRFDGIRFTTFGLEAGLPSVDVRALLEDREGTLWVATAAGGLGRWRDGRVESADPGGETAVVTCLAEDAEGRLWAGTREGLRCLQNGVPVNPPGLEVVASSPIRSLLVDHNGTLWIGSVERGLVAYRHGQATLCAGPPENELVVAHCLLSDSRGRLWVSVGNWKTLCLENDQWRVYGENDGLPFPFITSLAEDANGTLWAGSLDAGLYRFDGTRFQMIGQSDGLSAEDIASLHADREGNLWAGTRTGGLNQLRQRKVLFIGRPEGLTNDYVRGVAETPDGTLWVGTAGGSLYQGTPERFSPFRPGDARIGFYAHINPVLAARDGSLWWGGGNSLLQWHDGRIARAFTNDVWVRGKSISALCEAPDGGLWIGNNIGELIHHHAGQITVFPRRMARGAVTAMAVEPDGSLWVGSSGGGVKRIRQDTEVPFTLSRDLVSQSIRALYYDPSGTLWIGTAGGGLSCWHQGRLKNFSHAEGFTPRTVSQIVEDEHGFLWLGSHRGVFKIRKQDLLDCAEGRTTFVHARSFGINDGLRAEECSSGFSPAGLRTRSGLICISTVKGLAFLDPGQEPDETPPPRVIPEEVIVNGRPQPVLRRAAGDTNEATVRHLTLPPGGRELELHYTAIHFSAPEKIGFRYQLEGADNSWVQAGGRRIAYYQRLAPGHYTFRVQACNPDGVWGEPTPAMTLTVLPFFWETAWFRGGVILLASGTLWWLLRRRYLARLARLQMQNAIERERLRISKDMHDHVGGMLTQVSQLTDMTLGETENQEVVTARLNRIGKRSRDAVQALDEIVWATNPKNDNLASFAEYVSRFADEFFEYSGIRCWQDVPASLPALPLRADIRHNVFLAVREACNNVAKHSHATEVWIRLALDGDEVWLEVRDNGCGFALEKIPAGGNGLENMRARLAEDGGKTHLHSAPGRGTSVRFVFPIRA